MSVATGTDEDWKARLPQILFLLDAVQINTLYDLNSAFRSEFDHWRSCDD